MDQREEQKYDKPTPYKRPVNNWKQIWFWSRKQSAEVEMSIL